MLAFLRHAEQIKLLLFYQKIKNIDDLAQKCRVDMIPFSIKNAIGVSDG